MNRFVSAFASAPNWLEAASRCVEQATGRAAGRAGTLGFVYANDQFASDLQNLVDYLVDCTGVPQWVGSVGIGVCGTAQEYHDVPALSIMIADLPQDSYRVFGALHEDLTPFIERHGAWCEATQTRFAVVHGDPRNRRLPELITGVAAAVNDGFLVGGLTSTHSAYSQVCGQACEGGLSGVLFSPEVHVATTLTQSCAPFGPAYQVTDCDRNVIISLDHRPALEVFYESIGDILSRDLNKAARYIAAALLVPGSDTRDYLVRNLVGVDPRQKLLAIGDTVAPGQMMQFCRRDPLNAQQDMLRMLRDLKERVPNPPRGALYFSCVGRGPHMFGDQSEELRLIQQEFGDLPLAGFFCNGEISHNRLYGYTGVLTLFL